MTRSFSNEFVEKAKAWSAEESDRSLGRFIDEHWTDEDYDKWTAFRFEGKTFPCKICSAAIKWPGICQTCEKSQDKPSAPMNERLAALGIPAELAGRDWSNWEDDEKLNNECLESIEKIKEWRGKPPLLKLSGIPGIGKTHMAVATVARRLRSKGNHGVLWFGYLKLCEMLKDGVTLTHDSLLDTLRKRKLIIIDDFGQGQVASWMAKDLFAVICDRIDNGKPTIITTNLTNHDISEINQALGSRFGQALVLKSEGMKDRRKREEKENT